MRIYSVPPDTREKEKIIGGLLNINQFLWLLGGLVLGAVFFAVVYKLTGFVGLSAFIGILFASAGLPFAFYKKKEYTLYQYLYYKHKFKKKTKKLPNARKEVSE